RATNGRVTEIPDTVKDRLPNRVETFHRSAPRRRDEPSEEPAQKRQQHDGRDQIDQGKPDPVVKVRNIVFKVHVAAFENSPTIGIRTTWALSRGLVLFLSAPSRTSLAVPDNV